MAADSQIMSPRSETGFRLRLRRGTRGVHDAVEAAFQPFHDDPAACMPGFLRAQWLALEALARARGGDPLPEEGALLDDLLLALAQDGAAGQTLGSLPDLDPLAVAYVVMGSRLGTLVLSRRVTEAGVTPLPAYFMPRDSQDGWRRLCARLDALPPEDPRAARIETDVMRAFACFLAAAHHVRGETLSPGARTGDQGHAEMRGERMNFDA